MNFVLIGYYTNILWNRITGLFCQTHNATFMKTNLVLKMGLSINKLGSSFKFDIGLIRLLQKLCLPESRKRRI